MAGDEEARARAVLAEMQLRIAEGPTSALGIGEIVTPEDVRGAFLALTKQFHPARFGRLSTELQKLSNEVFLGIKASHDHMLKVLGSSTAASRGGSGGSNARLTPGGIPAMQLDGNKTSAARGTQSIPRVDSAAPHLARGTDRDGRGPSPVIGSHRTGTPPTGVPVSRSATPVGVPVSRSVTPLGVPVSRTVTPLGVPVSRTATPVGGSPRPTGAIPGAETPTDSQGHRPTGSMPTLARSDSGPTASPPQHSTGAIPFPRPGTPPPTGRAITPVPPGTVPGVGPAAQSGQGQGTQPIPQPRPITPVPPGTQPGVGTSRMVPIRTATGASNDVPVPAGQAGGGTAQPPRPITLRPGQSSPLAPEASPPKPITLRPGQSSPLAPEASPPKPITLRPGQSSPLAPEASPPKPITLPPGQTSPLTPQTQPPRGHDSFNPPTVRGIAAQSAPQHADTFDEAAAFRDAAALMEAKSWTAARQALHALAAKVPQSKLYRAWLCYARGREAYIAGRPNDAILEMQRALQLDPDLAHAKHALAELQRRR